MLENIEVGKKKYVFKENEKLKNLEKINFFYGPNASGKTVISRFILEEGEKTEQFQIKVYNSDFVKNNLYSPEGLAGIFTLGEENKEIEEKLKSLEQEIESAKKELGEKEKIKTDLEKSLWKNKEKIGSDFSIKFRNDKKLFTEKLVEMLQETNQKQEGCSYSYEDLLKKYKMVSNDDLKHLEPLEIYDSMKLNNILSKKIIGKSDVDISAMIKNLKNDDWVRQGRDYYSKNDGYCPFCQQKIDKNFAKKLEEYFDATYQCDIKTLESESKQYEIYMNRIVKNIDELSELIEKAKVTDITKDMLIKIRSSIESNKQHIERKKKELSVEIHIANFNDILSQINREIEKYNKIIDDKENEKNGLEKQVWEYVVQDNIEDIKKYQTLKDASDSLKEKIRNTENEFKALKNKRSNIKPTAEKINRMLKGMGFLNFFLALSDKEGFYEIIRSDKKGATETLSEGEKTFLTFLYFYYSLQKDSTAVETGKKLIVVIDDPISSLDTDVLFIVSTLIKNILEKTIETPKDDNCYNLKEIEQVFILTHNIYFHKEVSFRVKKPVSFYVIRKSVDKSVVNFYNKNPIKSQYLLLWDKIKSNNDIFDVDFFNSARRILECFFEEILGKDYQKIPDDFKAEEDQAIARGFISRMHDGSHHVGDDICVSMYLEDKEKLLKVFKKFFEITGYIDHYNHMIG